MAEQRDDPKVIPTTDVTQFFRDSVGDAMSNQQMQAGEHTVFYLVNLLAGFTHADELFEKTRRLIQLLEQGRVAQETT